MVASNNIIDIKLLEGSDPEPLTLPEVKEHLNITFTDFDSYLTAVITRVREQAEKICGICITEKTVTVIVCSIGGLVLPYGPIKTVTSPTDLAIRGQILTNSGEHTIIYTSGFEVVPNGLKQALLLEIGYIWEHRGDESNIMGHSPQFKQNLSAYNFNVWG